MPLPRSLSPAWSTRCASRPSLEHFIASTHPPLPWQACVPQLSGPAGRGRSSRTSLGAGTGRLDAFRCGTEACSTISALHGSGSRSGCRARGWNSSRGSGITFRRRGSRTTGRHVPNWTDHRACVESRPTGFPVSRRRADWGVDARNTPALRRGVGTWGGPTVALLAGAFLHQSGALRAMTCCGQAGGSDQLRAHAAR